MASSSEAMVAAVRARYIIQPKSAKTNMPLLSIPSIRGALQKTSFCSDTNLVSSMLRGQSHQILAHIAKASSKNESIVEADEEDGVQLGTMRLPPNIDIPRFESLLFQWANSLCQGANLPLPMPLKVDKITGGARLSFITIGDASTEVLVYIDCLVFPATGMSGTVFRAIRNGPTKDQSPPGEPRIMRSLQEALKRAVEIAKV